MISTSWFCLLQSYASRPSQIRAHINKAWIPCGAISIHYSIMYPQKNWPTYKLAGSQKSHPHPPLNQNPTPWLETGPVDTCEKYHYDYLWQNEQNLQKFNLGC